MFTGIIEKTAKILKTLKKGNEYEFVIENPFSENISSGDSIAVDGICLTVEKFCSSSISFFVSMSTAQKTIIPSYKAGTTVNLERAMRADGRFDGHIVQGHVDTVGKICAVKKINAGFEITVSFNKIFSNYIVPRGSVSINGISLTASESTDNSFSVSLIPETLRRTAFSEKLSTGKDINIEFDIIGKYVAKLAGKTEHSANLESLLGKL